MVNLVLLENNDLLSMDLLVLVLCCIASIWLLFLLLVLLLLCSSLCSVGALALAYHLSLLVVFFYVLGIGCLCL